MLALGTFHTVELFCIRWFDRCKWKRASARKQMRLKASVNLRSAVIFFDIPTSEQESFSLPLSVVKKLEEFAYCLFDE